VRLHQAGPESFKLSDTHTKSHKLICPGHGAPQSMAYSFTSVGKLSVYVRGAPLLYEKYNNAKCGVTRVTPVALLFWYVSVKLVIFFPPLEIVCLHDLRCEMVHIP
jgi:hypothetical protein